MSIDFSNESGLDIDANAIVSVAQFAMTTMDVHPAAELCIVLTDEPTIEQLHIKWLGLPGPTDVMSFPMDELLPGGRPDTTIAGPAILGDIVMCPAFAQHGAQEAGRTLQQELAILTVHGVLHLLGYDHANDEERREMFGIQDRIIDNYHNDRRQKFLIAKSRKHDDRLLHNTGFTPKKEE